MPAKRIARAASPVRKSAIPLSESRIYLQIYQLSAEKQRLEVQIDDWVRRKSELETQLEGVQHRILELKRHLPESAVVTKKRAATTPSASLEVIEY